jgi:hypothetical protein
MVMETSRWLRWDRWMRALHLYTGLFLVPWRTVYAVSAFCLNHKEWFTDLAATSGPGGRAGVSWEGYA